MRELATPISAIVVIDGATVNMGAQDSGSSMDCAPAAVRQIGYEGRWPETKKKAFPIPGGKFRLIAGSHGSGEAAEGAKNQTKDVAVTREAHADFTLAK